MQCRGTQVGEASPWHSPRQAQLRVRSQAAVCCHTAPNRLCWDLASSLCILGKFWAALEPCSAVICWLGLQTVKRTKMSRGRNDVPEGASGDPLERNAVEKRFTSVWKSSIRCLLCPYFNLFCKRDFAVPSSLLRCFASLHWTQFLFSALVVCSGHGQQLATVTNIPWLYTLYTICTFHAMKQSGPNQFLLFSKLSLVLSLSPFLWWVYTYRFHCAGKNYPKPHHSDTEVPQQPQLRRWNTAKGLQGQLLSFSSLS